MYPRLGTILRPVEDESHQVEYNPHDVSFNDFYLKRIFFSIKILAVSRLSGRQGSPDSMSNSYHGNTSSSSFMSGSSETRKINPRDN